MFSLIRSHHRPGTTRASLIAVILAVCLLLGTRLPARAQVSELSAGSSFNSTFTSGHAGWTPVRGAWSVTGAGTYQTGGLGLKWATAKHSGTYSNFVYAARLRRTGKNNAAYGLFIRGTPNQLASADGWANGYYLWITNGSGGDGEVAVYKRQSGAFSALLAGTPNAAVTPGDWNTLKVVAYNSVLTYYVNGALIYTGSDASFIASGRVGLGYFDGGTLGDKFSVDWAKLHVIPF